MVWVWMEYHRLPNRIMIWNPPGRGGRGQSRHAWMDVMTEV
jgi:hypothetical protein